MILVTFYDERDRPLGEVEAVANLDIWDEEYSNITPALLAFT